jgi:hypothetical protein
MRRLPASSDFIALKIGKQCLRIEFGYQGIISCRVVEGFARKPVCAAADIRREGG